jgi:hypothetical protein
MINIGDLLFFVLHPLTSLGIIEGPRMQPQAKPRNHSKIRVGSKCDGKFKTEKQLKKTPQNELMVP